MAAALESEDGEASAAVVNWSQLCPDLLQLAAKKLPDLSDFLRLRAVCRSWRLISDPPAPLPWLLFMFFPGARQEENGNLQFFSLSDKKWFTLPGAPHRAFRSSSHRYVVMWHKESRTVQSLYNPLSKETVLLPPTKLSWINEVNVRGGDSDSVIIYQGAFSDTFKWRRSDAEWTSRCIDVSDPLPMLACRDDGSVFYLDKTKPAARVFKANVRGPAIFAIPPPIRETEYNCFDYLIESSRDILGIWRETSVWSEQTTFAVYKLQQSGKDEFCWIKVQDIGDRILLLDKHGSTGLSVSNKDHGWKGNCIYFHGYRHVDNRRYTAFCRYNMKDGRAEELARLLEPQDCTWAWFVPCLH